MNNSGKRRKLAALFAVSAGFGICHVQPSLAFTLIETQLLPAVQLVASQPAAVKVSNTTSESIEAVISVYRGTGTLLVQKTVAIGPFSTYTLPIIFPNIPITFQTIVELGTAQSAVSDVMTFDKTTGQVTAILPFIKFDTN